MVKHTQTIRWLLPMNCFSVFDHSVVLVLKGLTVSAKKLHRGSITCISHNLRNETVACLCRQIVDKSDTHIYQTRSHNPHNYVESTQDIKIILFTNVLMKQMNPKNNCVF